MTDGLNREGALANSDRVRIEPGYRPERDIITERDRGLLEVFRDKYDFWLERHAGVILGNWECTREERDPWAFPPVRTVTYTEATVSTEKLREAIGELMRIAEKTGRGLPG